MKKELEMENMIRNLVKKKYKSTNDIEELYKYFKNVGFLEKIFPNKVKEYFDNKFYYGILSAFKFEKINENQVIFYENQYTNLKFYYLFKGKVGIYKDHNKNTKNTEIDNSKIEFELKKAKNKFRKSILITSNRNIDTKLNKKNYMADLDKNYLENLNIKNFELKKNLGEQILTLNPGDYFGENALMNYDQRRTASLVSLEKCEFFILNKEDFENKINNFMKIIFKNKKLFVEKCLGIDLYGKDFMRLINSSKKLYFKRGKNILNIGDEIKGIYLIYEGKCKLISIINKKKTEEYDYIFKGLSYKKRDIFKKLIFTPKFNLEELINFNFFGEEILFFNNCKSNYIIEVNSTSCEVLFIEKSSIKNNLLIYNFLKEILKEYYFNREGYREEKLKNCVNLFFETNFKKVINQEVNINLIQKFDRENSNKLPLDIHNKIKTYENRIKSIIKSSELIKPFFTKKQNLQNIIEEGKIQKYLEMKKKIKKNKNLKNSSNLKIIMNKKEKNNTVKKVVRNNYKKSLSNHLIKIDIKKLKGKIFSWKKNNFNNRGIRIKSINI